MFSHTLSKGLIYGEWTCACGSCSVTYFRERHSHTVLSVESTDEFQQHGDELHRIRLVRVFSPELDIHTSFEVVPLLSSLSKDIDEKIDTDIDEARKLLKKYRNPTKEGD